MNITIHPDNRKLTEHEAKNLAALPKCSICQRPYSGHPQYEEATGKRICGICANTLLNVGGESHGSS